MADTLNMPVRNNGMSEEQKRKIAESLKRYHAERRGLVSEKKVGGPDKLSQDVAKATAAGVSYGKWKAMQSIAK